MKKNQITLNWKKGFQKNFQFESFKLSTHISHNFKNSFYLLSWKSLSCIKFLVWIICKNEIQIFSKTLFILIGRSHVIFTLGFCIWQEFEFMEIRMQSEKFGKVISFPLIQLSKSFKFHSISHNQSHNNQTNNHKYLLI